MYNLIYALILYIIIALRYYYIIAWFDEENNLYKNF